MDPPLRGDAKCSKLKRWEKMCARGYGPTLKLIRPTPLANLCKEWSMSLGTPSMPKMCMRETKLNQTPKTAKMCAPRA